MPVWGQWVLGAAAVVGAVLYLWKTVFIPAVRAAAVADEMLPLLQEMTRQFRGKPYAFAVLDDIAAEFRTDNGSTLRDVIDRLERAAEENKAASDRNKVAAEIMSTKVEAVKVLSAEDRALAVKDRAQMTLLIKEVDRLMHKADLNMQGVTRLEDGAAVVADNLATEHDESK